MIIAANTNCTGGEKYQKYKGKNKGMKQYDAYT